MDSQTPQSLAEQAKRIEFLENVVLSLLRHANFTSDTFMYLSRGEPFREIMYVNQRAIEVLASARESVAQ